MHFLFYQGESKLEQVCCRMCETVLAPNGCSNQCEKTFIEKFQNNQSITFLPSGKCEICDKVFSCTEYRESPIVEIESEMEKTQREIDKLKSMI
jgi:hypothetical protein